MESPIVKRSIVIAGHKTSVSLEDMFWKAFKEIARERHVTKTELAAAIGATEREIGEPHRSIGGSHSGMAIWVAPSARVPPENHIRA